MESKQIMQNKIDTKVERIEIDNELYFKIGNSDSLRPFFMSIVSDSDHWMFISSNGGLTAGRKNSEYALFPYYTDDKITEAAEYTGSKSIFQIFKAGKVHVWEPFSIRNKGKYCVTTNLYKSQYGNQIIFEEINFDLDVSFRYQWSSSDKYGFVRQSKLENHSSEKVTISILDGIQNLMPAGVPTDLQNASSNLVDAYKRSELGPKTGLGIFALSAIIIDRAEPSEALKANVAWSIGLDDPKYLLSSKQLEAFRNQVPLKQETDIKGERGAYFVHDNISLAPQSTKSWMMVAEVNQSHSAIARLMQSLDADTDLEGQILKDINLGTQKLVALNASSDGLQCTADELRDSRHFSNTLFNIMRGGVFDDGYTIEKEDFFDYLQNASIEVFQNSKEVIGKLADAFSLAELNEVLSSSTNVDFKRLCKEYLPLKFSRRHGDPSRPWNRFSINTKDEKDGSKILDYEGNWRDIFQNWEALVHSYPSYIEGMIFRFVNASTFDGYNPYRVTKGGFDWETIEPDDPWSYIGYWGDHQIIYLLKFLEFIENHFPDKLQDYFDQNLFVYANVPYKIKAYSEIVKNPKDTIEFDEESDHAVRAEQKEKGADGSLLKNATGDIHRVNFIEKILASLLAKLSNYIPDGGIWMNTQRPEWNDANNALVGNGVSMVTLYYLRRYITFFSGVLERSTKKETEISDELLQFYKAVAKAFAGSLPTSTAKMNDADRKKIVDQLGEVGSSYRTKIYRDSFAGTKQNISLSELNTFFETVLKHIDQTIATNKRSDDIYHSYNLISLDDKGYEVTYLSEMLEGQVGVLSSGYLSSLEALAVLDGLKSSKLFRPDQYSYILYPQKELKGFLSRNTIPENLVQQSDLLKQLMSDGNIDVVEKDVFGEYHFNSNFRNADDLSAALVSLDHKYAGLVIQDSTLLKSIFESVFNHREFTGRSGTFYGYEGLGSIYWHMVSKLLLAAEEYSVKAVHQEENPAVVGRFLEHFYEINAGIGVHKSPSLYGAFPTDPYSHTPAYKGAQQPGMTGQVKEDILSRFGELGVLVANGSLSFDPSLLREEEFLKETKVFCYIDVSGHEKQLELQPGSLAFTYCQIPVVYSIGKESNINIHISGGQIKSSDGNTLSKEDSLLVFGRNGEINLLEVTVSQSKLR